MDFETEAVAEAKNFARRFIRLNFPQISHVLVDQKLITDGAEGTTGKCDSCVGPCSFRPDLSTQPDLLTAGIPCQPFSGLRWHKGAGANQRDPRSHSKFGSIDEFLFCLEKRHPRGFILEEVLKIMAKDPTTGETFLNDIMAKAASLGYGCAALIMNGDNWNDVPRQRHFTYIFFSGE